MPISEEMRRATDQALTFVRDDPRHDLNPGYRQAVFAAFGPRRDTMPDFPPETVPHQRRAILAILSIEKVLPTWVAAAHGNTLPQDLMRHAREELLGLGEREKLEQEVSDALGYLDAAAFATGDVAIFVGFAAARALGVALLDEPFDAKHINYEVRNADRDPWSTDTAEFAACAAANGAAWDASSDPTKRLAFWEWWLRDAIPQAWDAVDDHGNLQGRWLFESDEGWPEMQQPWT